MKAFIGPGNGEYRIVPICVIGEAHNVVCRALSSTPGLRNMPCSRIGLKLSNISAIRPATLPFAVQYSSSMRSSMVVVDIKSSSSELICLSLGSFSPLGTSAKRTLLNHGQLALEKSEWWATLSWMLDLGSLLGAGNSDVSHPESPLTAKMPADD